MQSYRASNRVPGTGLLVLALATVIGGLIVGAAVAGMAHFIYLVLVFPIIMGLVGGAILVISVRRGKVCSPWVAGLFGILIGLVIYGAYRYGEYIDAQAQVYDAAKADNSQVTEAQAADAMDRFLSSATGSTGFMGFVLYNAQRGIRIVPTTSPVSDNTSDLTFSGTWAWIYWGIELLIIVGFAAAMAYRQAAQPFCESCGTWYGKEHWIGSADKKIANDLKAALKGGNSRQVRAALSSQALPLPRLDLTYQRCENCATANPVVHLNQITQASRRNTGRKELLKGEVTPAQYTEITGQAL